MADTPNPDANTGPTYEHHADELATSKRDVDKPTANEHHAIKHNVSEHAAISHDAARDAESDDSTRRTTCECEGCDASPRPLCSYFCLACGYDLRGSVGSTRCPECGLHLNATDGTPRGEPSVASAWWRLWVPFVRPARRIWFVDAARTPPPSVRKLGLLAALAFILVGVANGFQVHRVEWVFFAEQPFEPKVKVQEDTWQKPKPPLFENADDVNSRYSFGSRSVHFGFGSHGGSSNSLASSQAMAAYWDLRGLRSQLVHPALPLQASYVKQDWVAPGALTLADAWASNLPIVLIAWFLNAMCLPRILRRVNQSEAACNTAMRQGFTAINRATFIGFLLLTPLWIFMATNPGNIFVEYFGLCRWIGRVLLFVLWGGAAYVAARGISFDKPGRFFPRKRLSIVIAAALHLATLTAVVGGYVAVRIYLARL